MDQVAPEGGGNQSARLTVRYSHERPGGGMPGTLSEKLGRKKDIARQTLNSGGRSLQRGSTLPPHCRI